MKNVWKKICAIAASILAVIVAYFLGRGLNRRGVSRVDDNLRDFGEHVSHTELGITDASDAVGDGRDTAGRIAELNRDAQANVDRAKELLRRAKERADRQGSQDGDSRKPD